MIESVEIFGKYRLVERLAAGGMAQIYKARVQGQDRRAPAVAIKRLHKQFCEDDDFVTMLRDEAQLAVQLKHRHIGEVFDLGCIDGQYFIVMEFIDGLDLHELTQLARGQNRQVPVEAIVYVISRVAEALHYAHTKRGRDGRSLEVVHRDVSPQNMMISIDGDVKLVDFGIAKARMRAQHTRAGIIKGKFYYMSPEQAHGSTIDARTDVYALGMVLYEVLSGAHPFDPVPDAELLRAVRTADFKPLAQVMPELPEGLLTIVERALARQVGQRYQSAQAVADDLKRFAAAELRGFGAPELAQWVRRYSDKHLPEQTRAADFEAMDSRVYAQSEHSVIFAVPDDVETRRQGAGDDFEDDETRVFLRDEEERTDAGKDDDFVDEATAMLNWEDDEASPSQASPEKPKVAVPAGADPSKTPPSPLSESTQRRRWTDLIRRGDRLFRRRPHLVGAALAALALCLLGLSGWLIWGPGEEVGADWHVSIGGGDDASADGATDKRSTVSVAVTTQPANARVYQDGIFVGHTPETLADLVVGESYNLRFERDGHEAREVAMLAESQMSPLVVRLEPLGGIIRVRSAPQGTQIYRDGQLEGRAPVTLMGLDRQATHAIEARRGDEAVEEVEISWADDDPRILEIALGEEPPGASIPPRLAGADGDDEAVGWLNIRVDAAGGHIYVDDELVKDDTLLVGHEVSAGEHSVKVYFPDADRYSEGRQVDLAPGETATLRFSP